MLAPPFIRNALLNPDKNVIKEVSATVTFAWPNDSSFLGGLRYDCAHTKSGPAPEVIVDPQSPDGVSHFYNLCPRYVVNQ